MYFFYFIYFQNSYVFLHTHTTNCRSISILDHIDNNSTIANYDFKNPIYQAEDEGEEDCEVSGELARLLEQEERSIHPYEESVEVVNLGT